MTRRTRARGRRGFTLVEVMIAVSVMTAGAVAIFAMQNVTATGARRSRMISTATEVNRFWIERVKVEALRWGPVAFAHPSMTWLNALPAGETGSSGWFLPAARGTGDDLVTAASDWYGAPIPIPAGAGVAPAPYCTSLRWTWMSTGTDQVARLDVRTWWHRPGRAAGTTIAGCGADQNALTNALTDITSFGAIYGSTVVRWQGLPQ
jgi:prepilin-type N-terminal cleavage/methylation domain-containing protein